jgi:hypothetical protein
LLALAPAFTQPTFRRFVTRLAAALLTTGRHTVANLLRTAGPLATGHRTSYQRVLSAASWSALRLACLLARFLLVRLCPRGIAPLAGDDTVDGHKGKHVHGKARQRDPVRSSHSFTAWRYGHKWVALCVLVRFPGATRPWALPVLVTLYRSAQDNRRRRRPHRTPAQLMCVLLRVLLRWFPDRRFVFVGDAGYGTHEVARFRDEDFTTETVPGDNTTLQHKGRAVDAKTWRFKDDPRKQAPSFSLAVTGSIMPPPAAVAGTYAGPDGHKIKVAPLTDEDRLTIVRWIDLGCPIDLDFDPAHPERRGYGFACDDQRPTLTLTYPQAGANLKLSRILVGMHDYYSGLDLKSFRVVADFPLDGAAAGQDLAKRFKPTHEGVWELKLTHPVTRLVKGKLTVSVKDRQGNVSKIERTFSVAEPGSAKR